MDRVGLETERELTGGVHVKTHHDSLGRETYKSVGARNVEQFRRSYTWGIGNRLHATEDGLTGRRVRYDYDEFDNLLSAEYKQGNDVERIYVFLTVSAISLRHVRRMTVSMVRAAV